MTQEPETAPDFVVRPRLARWLADGSSFVVVRTVLLRLLGGVYFVAFLSTLLQGRGLIGERGLLPMHAWLHAIGRAQGGKVAGFLAAPSIFWVNDSDAMLVAVMLVGMALSFAVVLGVTNAAVMIALWAIQFSLYDVGQIFWGYGWEMQLLETGMLAAIACPLTTWRPFASAPPTVSIWLFRWLIARVMLGAGLIKLRGDACWTDLTCLQTHYETQPNPSPLSWLLHQMPPSFHAGGVLVNHFVELIVPFLILGPRGARRVAGCFFVAFQAILIASGNLSFLNWLTIVPALACFDDAFLLRGIPKRLLRQRGAAPLPRPKTAKSRRLDRPFWVPVGLAPSRAHRRVAIAYALLVGILSFGPIGNLLSDRQAMNASFDPLHLVNTYGAFGSVNRFRNEIVLEGSADGHDWKEYEFPCKPGDVTRRPCLVSPYHYRLDWQMWFAAMSSYDDEPWIVELAFKMLHNDPVIDPLLAKNPFTGGPPPRFVRARLFRYEMTTWRTRKQGWWTRRDAGPDERGSEYLRPLSLDDPDLDLFLRMHRPE